VTTTSRSPKLGYALAATAATLWALNGSLSRFLLDDHLPPARLAELRSVCTFAVLPVALTASRPSLLRVHRTDLGRLAVLGMVGFAGNTALYYAAIARLQIGRRGHDPVPRAAAVPVCNHVRHLPLEERAGRPPLRAAHDPGLGVRAGDVVLGALLAWPIRGQALSPIQLAGGLAVIGAVVWVRTQRQVVEAELAPAFGTRRRRRAARPAARPATHVE
jgi:hypothetical protein